ncbi:MAG: alpha/beta hydrolase [Actinomycetota bacterium]|nr:alpha/beta hydrolase [Actinomycetota bacterium]
MPDIDRGTHRIHWDETGSGSALLLIMGAAYSSRLWYPAVPALSARHRTLTFDNRGTGGSTATKVASISDMAGDARAVLDAAGVENAHVYGVSLGGVVAQQLALESPERVRSLVLGCTGILSRDKPRAPKALRLLLHVPRRWLVSMTSYGPACPPERAAADKAVLLADVTDPVGLIAQQDALRAYAVEPEQVATLSMPTLVLHGTADKTVKPEWGAELAETLPHSRFITYEGAGHNFLVAAGDQPNADVLDFLADVDATAAPR